MFRKHFEGPRSVGSRDVDEGEQGEGRMSATGGIAGQTHDDEPRMGTAPSVASETSTVPSTEGSTGVGGTEGSMGTPIGSAYIEPTPRVENIDRRVDDLERRLDNLAMRQSSGVGAGMSSMGQTVQERASSAGDTLREKKQQVGDTLRRTGHDMGERVAEVRDVTAERLGQAGDAVRQAMQEVEIEEFRLRGNMAGHPFRVDLGSEGGDRVINFEVNLRTDTGDMVRISGRKRLSPGDRIEGGAGATGTTGTTGTSGSGTANTWSPSHTGNP